MSSTDGSGVVHISQAERDGWLMNVQAGQAMDPSDGGAGDAARDEREDLGTPHSEQTFAAVGLSPAPFLNPQTSHSQIESPLPPPLADEDVVVVVAVVVVVVVVRRCNVTFGDDLNRPA